MAIVCQKKTENEEIIYVPPVQSVLMQKSNDLVKQFGKYANAVGLASGEVSIQRAILPRVILRVDKREGYFVVFHKGTQINEIKQAALVAYWILKFKPFMVSSDDPKRCITIPASMRDLLFFTSSVHVSNMQKKITISCGMYRIG